MPTVRWLAGAGITGVLGAVLVAVLVLGRVEVAGGSGRVLHVQTEVFVRENPFREFRDRPPERTVRDVWTLPGDRRALGITVTSSTDGTVRWRSRFGADDAISERVEPEFVLVRPRAGVPLPDLILDSQRATEESVAALFMDVPFGRSPGPRVADVRYFATFPVQRSDGTHGALTTGFAGDLEADELEIEVVARGGLIRSKHVWAVLDDGTRVLIESLVSRVFTMPTSRWSEIEAAVWGE